MRVGLHVCRHRGRSCTSATFISSICWTTAWILRSESTSSRSDVEARIEDAQYGAEREEDRRRYGHRAEVTTGHWWRTHQLPLFFHEFLTRENSVWQKIVHSQFIYSVFFVENRRYTTCTVLKNRLRAPSLAEFFRSGSPLLVVQFRINGLLDNFVSEATEDHTLARSTASWVYVPGKASVQALRVVTRIPLLV